MKKVKPIKEEIYQYLLQYREELPEWLANFKEGDPLSFKTVISSRIAYYPGFQRVGSVLVIGNKSQIVHSFIHTDYLNNYNQDVKQLKDIAGYHSIGHFEWDEEDLFPNRRKTHGKEFKTMLPANTFQRRAPHHYLTEILERNDCKNDDWGSKKNCGHNINGGWYRFLLSIIYKQIA